VQCARGCGPLYMRVCEEPAPLRGGRSGRGARGQGQVAIESGQGQASGRASRQGGGGQPPPHTKKVSKAAVLKRAQKVQMLCAPSMLELDNLTSRIADNGRMAQLIPAYVLDNAKDRLVFACFCVCV